MKIKNLQFLHSISVKFMVIFLLLGVLPVTAFGVWEFRIFFSAIEENSINDLSKMQLGLTQIIEDDISALSDIPDKLRLYVAPTAESDDNYIVELFSGMEQYSDDPRISVILNSLLQSNSSIENIILINKKGVWNCTSRYKKYRNVQYDFTNGDLISQIKQNGENVTLIPSHAQEYFLNMSDYVISVTKNYYYSGVYEGTIMIDVNLSYFDRLFNKTIIPRSVQGLYLVTENNYCIFANNAWDIDTKLDYSQYPVYSVESDIKTALGKERYIYIRSPIQECNWKLLVKIDTKMLTDYVNEISGMFIFLICVVVILLLIISLYFSKKLSYPILNMKKQMKLVQEGNFDVRLKDTGKDEFSQIASTINEMIKNLELYIQRSYDAQLKQKDAELNALKMQINPHFLYNTLEIIHMTAIQEGSEKISTMVLYLSTQLRYLLSANGDLVKLSEELEMIEQYFSFIKIRYNDDIKLVLKINPDLKDVMILKLILQPIIENSIKHGYVDGQQLKIVINAKMADDHIKINIYDNGQGMDADKLQSVKEYIYNKNTAVKPVSVGLKNVFDRIRFLYGEAYTPAILSSPGGGTIVKLRLPIIKEGDIHE